MKEIYKTLDFLNMMISMGIVCEECGDKPEFLTKWWFIPTPEAAGSPIICPTCIEDLAKKKKNASI